MGFKNTILLCCFILSICFLSPIHAQSSPSAVYIRSLSEYKAQNYANAINNLELLKNSDSANPWYQRSFYLQALALWKMGYIKESEISFSKYLKFRPEMEAFIILQKEVLKYQQQLSLFNPQSVENIFRSEDNQIYKYLALHTLIEHALLMKDFNNATKYIEILIENSSCLELNISLVKQLEHIYIKEKDLDKWSSLYLYILARDPITFLNLRHQDLFFKQSTYKNDILFQLYQAAKSLENQGSVTQAASLYQYLLESDPPKHIAQKTALSLANLYYQDGTFEQSRKQFQNIKLSAIPADKIPYIHLKKSRLANESRDILTAQYHINQGLNHLGLDYTMRKDFTIEEAKSYFIQKKFHTAYRSLAKIKTDPLTGQENPDVAFFMGLTHYARGQYQSAYKKFEALTRSLVYEESALYWAGKALWLKNSKNAYKYFSRLASKYPFSIYISLLNEQHLPYKKSKQRPNFHTIKPPVEHMDGVLLEIYNLGHDELALKGINFMPNLDQKTKNEILAYWYLKKEEPALAIAHIQEKDKILSGTHTSTIKQLYPYLYRKEISKTSQNFNIPASWILSFIRTFSSFKENYVSLDDKYGLIPFSLKESKLYSNKRMVLDSQTDLFTPENNLWLFGNKFTYLLEKTDDSYFISSLAFVGGKTIKSETVNNLTHYMDLYYEVYLNSPTKLKLKNIIETQQIYEWILTNG